MNFLRKIFFVPFFTQCVKEILAYIRNESPQNADQFEQDLKKAMENIAQHPESYPAVQSFPNRRKRYRFAVFKKNWKIYFKVLKEKLIFLAMIHVKRHPDQEKEIRKQE